MGALKAAMVVSILPLYVESFCPSISPPVGLTSRGRTGPLPCSRALNYRRAAPAQGVNLSLCAATDGLNGSRERVIAADFSPSSTYLQGLGNGRGKGEGKIHEGTVEKAAVVSGATVTAAVGGPGAGPPMEDVVKVLGLRFQRWVGGESREQGGIGEGERPKQVLLYLPGVEGLGTSIEPQLPSLSETFDVYRLLVPAEDRSTFLTLSRACEGFLTMAQGKTVVVGESFGGVLALRLGQIRPDLVQSVYAVNPATSFTKTPWRALGPLLTLAPPTPYKAAAIAVFAATIPDQSQVLEVMGGLLDPNNGRPFERPAAIAGRLAELWDMVVDVSENLPPATLRWRLQNWLVAGATRVERGLSSMKVPVTAIGGASDRLLPSAAEVERLERVIPGCRKMLLQGHGHAPFFDGRVDLLKLILEDPAMEGVPLQHPPTPEQQAMEDIMGGVFSRDWVGEFVYPNATVVEEGRKAIDFLIKSLSPVFVSTTEEGRTVSGLGGVPDSNPERPILFVGNHQLMALDLGLLIERLLTEKDILARGLTHPILFMGTNATNASPALTQSPFAQALSSPFRTPPTPSSSAPETSSGKEKGEGVGGGGGDNRVNGIRDFFTKFGAVPVTPRNMYRLFQRKEDVLLFPGGISEAYHKKGEEYKIFWPEKGEFVRMAAEAGAIIVPFSAVGMADSLEMVLDSNEVMNLPILGDRLRKQMEVIPDARLGRVPGLTENFVSPFLLPKLPARQYFRFGKPIRTEGLDRRDRAACQQVYEQVKEEVEVGIEALLVARTSDPFADPPKRLLYEAVAGGAAPTFQTRDVDAAVEKIVTDREGVRRAGSGDRPERTKKRNEAPSKPLTSSIAR